MTSRLVSPLTLPLIYLFSNFTSISPNQITFISFLFGLFSAISFYYEKFLLSSIFFLLLYIFDCIDGRLAKLKNQSSELGDMFDHVFGELIILILLIPIFFHFYLQNMDSIVFLLLLFTFLSPFNYFVNYFFKYTFTDFNGSSSHISSEVKLVTSDSNNLFFKLYLFLKSKNIKSIPSDIEANHLLFLGLPIAVYLNSNSTIFILLLFSNIILLINICLIVFRNIYLVRKS